MRLCSTSKPLACAVGMILSFHSALPLSAAAEGPPETPPASAPSRPNPFTHLPQHFLQSFYGYKLAFQISAVGSTAFFIGTGADGNIYSSYTSGQSDGLAAPAYWIGFLMAPVVGGAMYLVSEKNGDNDLYLASMAGLQAAVIALGYTTLIKFFTGRPAPGEFSALDVYEQSRYWRPGFGRGGVYNGWPSGHAMGAAAFTSAIATYYDSTALWIAASLTTAYIAWGMTAGTRGTEHWFSDIVAGTLIGYSIGSTVGEEFQKHRVGAPENPKTAGFHPHFSPVVVEGGLGVRAFASF